MSYIQESNFRVILHQQPPQLATFCTTFQNHTSDQIYRFRMCKFEDTYTSTRQVRVCLFDLAFSEF